MSDLPGRTLRHALAALLAALAVLAGAAAVPRPSGPPSAAHPAAVTAAPGAQVAAGHPDRGDRVSDVAHARPPHARPSHQRPPRDQRPADPGVLPVAAPPPPPLAARVGAAPDAVRSDGDAGPVRSRGPPVPVV